MCPVLILLQLVNLIKSRVELVTSFFEQFAYPAQTSTRCRLTVLGQQRSSFDQISDVFRGVMTPSLMPTGPDT